MPRPKVSLNRLATKLRHLRLAKALVCDGKNYREACEYAGYSKLTALRSPGPIVKSAMPEIQEIMDLAGITLERIAEKGAELLEAKQFSPVTIKQKDGSIKLVTWEAPDPRVQQKNLELMAEMKGVRRWGLPGSVTAQSNIQINVSFGNGEVASSGAGIGPMPVSINVTKPSGSGPPELPAMDEDPEEPLGPDPTDPAP